LDTEWFKDLNRLYARLAEHLALGVEELMGLALRPGHRPTSLEACYQLLGLTPEASLEEVKRRYRELAMRLHPDVAGPETAYLFQMVTQAYQQIRQQKEGQ
jgi:DnaJ-class molecular chaperone